MKRTSHYSKKNSTKGIVYSRSRFLLFAKKKKNSNPLSLSLPPDIRLFSNKRANAWHARVTLISFDGVTFTTLKKRKKKYKILGAESSASGTWGEDGENCWIRRGGGNFFFFFFSKCRRYKTWNTNVPREAGGTIDTTTPIFTRIARTLLSFFFSLSPYTRTGWIAVLLFSLLNERWRKFFEKWTKQRSERGNLMTIMIVIKRSKISKNKTCN